MSNQATALLAAYFETLSPSLTALIQLYSAHKAPHALMLSGQFGVGKRTLASILAQALLCEAEGKPCGICKSCKRAVEQTHSNFLVVKTMDKQRSVKVEQARALQNSLSTYPFLTGPRVVLLEQIDVFTPQAQNALLKSIEEPDANTFFLLTCENEQAVLTTIRSRCQIQRIPPWPTPLLEKLLIEKKLPGHEARTLSVLSGGSPANALNMRNDQQFWDMKELVDEAVLSLDSISSFPHSSSSLKNLRDQSLMVLDYIENAAMRLIDEKPTNDSATFKARSLLEGVLTARKHQASNLSWQAICDYLLLQILEDQTLCQM
ncbi:MAG: AAA family ATPase [Clostridiales bacterium]|nr:AAA family ATPase [Clostridiales bacterium]